MNKWISFFFGSPKRFLYTSIVVAVLIAMDKAGMTKPIIDSIYSLLQPFIGPIAQLVLLVIAFRVILSMFVGRKK